jgi:hypothetical protein
MTTQVIIDGITGKSPFDIYVCEGNGQNCLYINTISENSYVFTIPSPYDMLNLYMLKIIDANKLIITGIQEV